MKFKLCLVLLFGTAIFSAFTLSRKQTTLYIIGDSTAANKSEKAYPETGWGMALQAFFKDDVKVDNRA